MDVTVAADQPGRDACGGQPGFGLFPGHDGRCRRGVRIGAGGRGDARRPPRAVGGKPGPRVHDVMQHPAAAPPPAAGHRRRGDRSAGQPDQLRPGRIGTVGGLGHGDRPAAAGRGPADGDVPAEADQYATCGTGRGGDGPYRPVGADALGRGAEVQPDARRQPEQRAVEPYPLPSRRGNRGGGRLAAPGVEGREVAVVAETDQGVADCRIGQAAGPAGRGQRHADGARQAVTEQEQATSGLVHPAELRIRAEPARLPVKRVQDIIGGGAGRAEMFRRPHHDAGAGAQGVALRGGHHVITGHHRLP